MIEGNRLIELIEAAGFEPSAYSGRAMYGKSCVSFRTHERSEAFVNLSKVVGKAGTPQEGADVVCYVARDSMGMGDVLYWPQIAWPNDRPEFDEPVEAYEE